MRGMTRNAVRLSDGRPACVRELLLKRPLAATGIPALASFLARGCEAANIGADVAVEFALVSVGGEPRCGLNIRLRAMDCHVPAPKLESWGDWLRDCASEWLAERNVAHQLCGPSVQGTLRALPEKDFLLLRKQRRVGLPDASGTGAPAHYFTASPESFQPNAEALARCLKRRHDSGLSLTLMRVERTREETRILDAACAANAAPAYVQAYRDARDAAEVYACVALVWGGAAGELLELLRASGLEFRAIRPEPDATLPYELAFDPWAVRARLARRLGNEAMGRIACSFTPGELERLFSEKAAPALGQDALQIPVRPDPEKIARLSAMDRSLGGASAAKFDSGAVPLGDLMRTLGELSQKLDTLANAQDLARVADLEAMKEELRDEIIAQARQAASEQSAYLDRAVQQINENVQTSGLSAEQVEELAERAFNETQSQLTEAVERLGLDTQERLDRAVQQINTHTQAQVDRLARDQAEAFARLFRSCAQESDGIEAVLAQAGSVAAQTGFRAELGGADLQLMGYHSEQELRGAGMTDDLLQSLRYAVALYRLAGKMELADDEDCLPFGFMLGCLYEQLMMRCFRPLYECDSGHRTPSSLKNFDAMDDERIERYVRNVHFADGRALNAQDWIAWFNVFYALRQLRNRVHAEAGRMGRAELDGMFRALLSEAAVSRANLVAQNYSRVDDRGFKTERVYIPLGYRADTLWQKAPGRQDWSETISNYMRQNPAPFKPSAMQFILSCANADWN